MPLVAAGAWTLLTARFALQRLRGTSHRPGDVVEMVLTSAVTAIRRRFGTDEFAAWRYSEAMLIPLRPKIRRVARALLVHPRHIPQPVVAALAAEC